MQSRNEDILTAIADGTSSSQLKPPQSREETLLMRILDRVNDLSDLGGKFKVHICTSSEYDHITGIPTILGAEENTFYLVPSGGGTDMYKEWVYTNGNWELFGGGGGGSIDAPVQDVQVNGTSIVENGVANVSIATASNLGVVKGSNKYGITINGSGELNVDPALASLIRNNSGIEANRKPITPSHEAEATFYGLGKAAGFNNWVETSPVGQYTESAKSAISEMLNGSVSVSGTAPVINALPGIRYVCGEVVTLDITIPASGCIDVTFESGSTPTVLTVTPPTGVTVKWANGFDPTSLEANTTYEINVCDGLGVAASWT